MLFRPLLLCCWIALPLAAADTRLVRETEALTPDQERAALHVPEGFEVQLFASEPQINKPINIAFDARGRLWVSSTVEYPYCADKSRWSDPQGTHVKDSRDAIKILEDTDGDGCADKVTDFADGLNIPTGVLPWRRPEHKAGCIAWSIPNIWYFADTDGDDKADVREVLFGPLGYEKDTHGMCSSFRLGLDGWVYATHGFNNTSHIKARDGSTLDLHSGNVFRFRPDGSRVEIWSWGQVNPFGLCWDKYNNLYSADCHSSPVYQLLKGAHYPSFGKPHDGLGFAPVMCEHTHGSTGICGITYIDGGVWGTEWDDHLFVGNVVTSKINHDHVTFTGATPRANEQPDFLTSDDPWFRPVDIQLGPDSALYIADFYNRIIGHYEVPLEHPGRDKERGRIWRVVKKGVPSIAAVAADPVSSLGGKNLTRRLLAVQHLISDVTEGREKLTSMLNAPGTADEVKADILWTMLRSGAQGAALKAVKELAAVADAEEARGALMVSLLRMIESVEEWPFQSESEFARCFSYSLEGISSDRVHRQALALLAAHPRTEAYVVTQLLSPLDSSWALFYDRRDLSLMHTVKLATRALLSRPDGFAAFTRIGTNPEINDFVRIVALSVPSAQSADFVLSALSSDDETVTAKTSERWLAEIGHVARNHEVISKVVAFAQQKSEGLVMQSRALQAIYNGLSERGISPPPELLSWGHALAGELLATLKDRPQSSWDPVPASPDSPSPAWSLKPRKCADGTEAQVLQSMAGGGGDEEKRTGTLRSKIFKVPSKLSFWINGHRGPPGTPAHEKNVVKLTEAATGATLASAFPPRSDRCELVEWDLAAHAGKEARLEIVDGDSGKAYAWLGITRMGPPVVSVEDFQSENAARESLRTLAALLQHTAPAALREKLSAFLPPRPAPPPLPVTDEQRKQLDALITGRISAFKAGRPDLAKGQALFAANCAACHQVGGQGGLIGPQLDGIGNRGVERLCEDILDPNRNVDAHFHLHTLTLKDGTAMSGFLKAEAGQVLILADAAGKEHRVSKAGLAKDDITPMSLMPPIFGQTIPQDDFVNLLGWLLRK